MKLLQILLVISGGLRINARIDDGYLIRTFYEFQEDHARKLMEICEVFFFTSWQTSFLVRRSPKVKRHFCIKFNLPMMVKMVIGAEVCAINKPSSMQDAVRAHDEVKPRLIMCCFVRLPSELGYLAIRGYLVPT